MDNVIIPCGKLIGLLFSLLLFLLSFLFLKPNVCMYIKTFSRTELARPVMGTIFLVYIFFLKHEVLSYLVNCV